MVRLPLTAKAIAQASGLAPSSLQLTTPFTTRFPSLTVKTPFATPSWSLDDPSRDANVCVPVMVTSCANAAGVRISSDSDSRSRTDRDFIPTPPLGLSNVVWTQRIWMTMDDQRGVLRLRIP